MRAWSFPCAFLVVHVGFSSAGLVDVIYGTSGAFAAKLQNGTAATWGSSGHGGDSSSVSDQLTNVEVIVATYLGAFAAKKIDGTVVTWGDKRRGGDSSRVSGRLTNVEVIYATKYGFAAKKTDGTVVTWGD